VSLNVTITGSDRRIRFDWDVAAAGWIEAVEPTALALMRAHAPFFTGALRKGIGSKKEVAEASATITIYGTASYLPYLLNGTQDHGPVHAKALRWLAKGTGIPMFAYRVKGIKPMDFPETAMEAGTPMFTERFAAACREAVVIE
jgi:hypothetical protein